MLTVTIQSIRQGSTMRLFEFSDWTEFASTMGEACCDIQGIFRDLLSESPGRRARGRELIAQWPHEEARLIGQLDALPLATKCLIELLSDDRTPERGKLLAAMIALFDGVSYLSSKHIWRLNPAAVLHRQVRNEFVAGLPLFVELLTSDDEALRKSAANAMYIVSSPNNTPALERQLQRETSDSVVAAILEAMVPLRPTNGANIGRSRMQSDHPKVSVRAAQLAAVCELPFPNDGLAKLAQTVLGPEPSLPQSSIAYSAIVSIGGLDAVAEIWMERSTTVPDEDLHEYYCSAIQLVLTQPGPAPDLRHQHLPLALEIVLEFFARDDRYWSEFEESGEESRASLLGLYNLPSDRASLLDRFENPSSWMRPGSTK